MKKVFLVALILFAFSSMAYGQAPNVVNPDLVQFTPSDDHAQIEKYILGWFSDANTLTPISEVDLGKPTPDTNNLCSTKINSRPLPFKLNYYARVRAVAGTFSSDWSDPSNPFDRKPGKSGTPIIK